MASAAEGGSGGPESPASTRQAQRKKGASAPSTPTLPQAATLRRILEDAASLKSSHSTLREVTTLRQAYDKVVASLPPGQLQALVTQCDNVLWQLETHVKATPDARTGDEDRELKGAEAVQVFNIPRRRRIQTLVLSCFTFFTGVPACIILYLVLLFNRYTAPFMILYAIWMWISRPRHPLKQKNWYKNAWFLEQIRDYFPIRLVVPRAVRRAVTDSRNYIFCYHPHGVHSFGAAISFGCDANDLSKQLPGITVHIQTLGMNFWIPFWREMILATGDGDASAPCIKKTLASGRGQSVLLVIGGAEESLMSSPKTNDLLLSKRKGFVKIALQTGSPLVPVFGFGENNVYGNYADGRPWLQKLLKQIQKKIGFAIPLIKGRGWFTYSWGPLPHRRPIVTVVGEPLDVPKIVNPTQADIDSWHARYCDRLLQLYRDNKDVYDLSSKTTARIVQ